MVGAFTEASAATNAYCGELIGLMAIHLVLLAVNTVVPGLNGLVQIDSDCLGTLSLVAELPPHCIPTQCWHVCILKTILVNCSNLSFQQEYKHAVAHQDDRKL